MFSSNRVLKDFFNPLTLLLAVALIMLCYCYFDRPLVDWLYSLDLRDRFPLLTWVTQLGNFGIDLLLFFVAALFFRYVYVNSLWEERAWFLWLCVALSNVVCGVLKVILGRARPDLWLQLHEYGFSWLTTDSSHMSFPSGHTTTIMSVAFGFSVIFPRFWPLFVLGGILVALSRVLLLQHYLSDVLVAIVLTLLVVTSLVAVLRKKKWLSRIC
ncbi:MAG: hypothetical protein A3F46_00385 [Legionellales bacterium RIFCSPHIGHO2_12_FULL_42_9]|nr:MAG: hypothetical protein A3F46_00385 [Legionellales bacterium RIFCSPHIGHO2_12_FULL_42_9]